MALVRKNPYSGWAPDCDLTCPNCGRCFHHIEDELSVGQPCPGCAADHEMSALEDALEDAQEAERAPHLHEYAFDLKLVACIRVKAKTEAEALALLREHVDAADCNFGAWPNGDPILGEASLDDVNATAHEIDGEAV